MVTLLTKKDMISNHVVHALWEIFSLKTQKFSKVQARGALIILSMAANARPEIISSKINSLLSISFEKFKGDEHVARYTCIALKKIMNTPASESGTGVTADVKQSRRLKADQPIFEKLAELIKDSTWTYDIWCSVAEQVINAVYVLHENPDHFFTPLIKVRSVFNLSLNRIN